MSEQMAPPAKANIAGQMNRIHHKLGSSPLILFGLGVVAGLLWLAATIVQIQTSEYLALGSNLRVAGVTWSVLNQPYLLITGQAPIQYSTAWIYGWVVEVVTLIFALALSVAVAKIGSVNPALAKGFAVCGLILIGLNSWADYSASPGSSPMVQALIALAVGGIAVVGLPLSVGLIEKAVEEY